MEEAIEAERELGILNGTRNLIELHDFRLVPHPDEELSKIFNIPVVKYDARKTKGEPKREALSDEESELMKEFDRYWNNRAV